MDFSLPPVGEGLLEVEIVRWLVTPGESVRPGHSLVEVMSDKATMEVTATFAGTISETTGEPGAKLIVGQQILKYSNTNGVPDAEPVPANTRPTEALKPKASKASPSPASLPAAAPSVRLLARKLGIDLAQIRGSGPSGRILVEDLTEHIKPSTPSKTEKSEPHPIDVGLPGTKQKLVGLRRKIAERMVQSTQQIPHYSYIDECELTDLVRLRSQLKSTFYRVGVKLTFLPFFVKAVSRALKEVPIVNSTFNSESGEITLHDHYSIGFAVATPGGLIVPVIRDADQKDIAAIASEIERLSIAARNGKVKIEDLREGTFTITSIGNIGGLISTPIINPPEVGIMGIGKVVKRPVYDAAGAVRPADLVYLSFSFDHRVLDGAVGAMFGNAVNKHLANPAALLLPERFAG